jgi:two-component system sensor histidine kinase KdpD
VEAILDAGIHVISTMNIQHLESLGDAVATITGAPVHERLPDDVLLRADEIELVDMSPHALRQRMKHGNVYPPERTRVALERFFTEANLTALRELALRVVAHRVEGQLEGVNHATLALVSERVLVLVDGSRGSGRAVRRAASLAGALHAGLVALVPPSEAVDAMAFDRAKDLREALDVAVELGARTARLGSGDSAEAVGAAVRELGATHLFVAQVPPGRLDALLHRSLVERLAEQLPDVDLHVVGGG